MSNAPTTDRPSPAPEPPSTNWMERALLLRAGEAPVALLGAAYFFCVLLSYYMMRPLRESFGIARGADKLAWLMTGTLVVMLLANPLFAWLVSRLPRRRFIPIVYHFFGANLVVFFVLFRFFGDSLRAHTVAVPRFMDASGVMDGKTLLGYAFYIWLSIFNLFVVSVFWGFMADGMGKERGRRLFGFLGIGGTLGALCGSSVVGSLIRGAKDGPEVWWKLDAHWMVLLSLIPLELCVVCVWLLVKRFGRIDALSKSAPVAREPGPGVMDGLRLIGVSPYLRAIAMYMLLFTVTSTLLYYQQGKIIETTYPDDAARTAAFANIDLYVNILSLVAQVFVTGRLITGLGVGVAISILPIVTLLGFGALALHPAIAVVTVFQVIRRGLHYAVDRPARETLFAGLSPDAIYKSKPFIDTFVYRAGDMAGGWMPRGLDALGVWLGWAAGAALGWGAVAMAVAWVAGAVMLGRRPEVRARASAEDSGG